MAIVLKINLGDDTRRISFDKPPSYEELTQIVKQLFRISVVQLKYEDEDKDRITVTSQVELNEAYQLASRHLNNVLRVFVSETPVASSLEANFLAKMIHAINVGAPSDAPASIVGSPAIQEVLTRLGLSRASPLPSLARSPSPKRARSRSPKRSSSLVCPTLVKPSSEEVIPAVSVVVEQHRPSVVVHHRGVTCDGCKTANFPGIRYKCTVCRNYDLCETCKAKGEEIHPSVHAMTIIKEPVSYVRRGHCYRVPVRTSSSSDLSPSPTTRNVATLIKHVNYARPELLESGAKVTKTWRVRNDGSTVWPFGTVLIHVGGSGVPASNVIVPLAAPGEEVDISVDIIMPNEYFCNCFFRLSTAEGDRFGKRMRACFFNKNYTSTIAQVEINTQTEEEAEEKRFVEAAEEEIERLAKVEAERKRAIQLAAEEEAVVKQKVEEEKKIKEQKQREEEKIAAEEAKKSSITIDEAVAIGQLADLGFGGDLLSVIRKNGGDVNAAALELMG